MDKSPDISQFIGFIITMLAFGILVMKQVRDGLRRKTQQVESPEDPEIEDLAIKAMPVAKIAKQEIEKSDYEMNEVAKPTKKKHKARDPYAHQQTHTHSYALMLKKISLKEVILLREILGPPKGL